MATASASSDVLLIEDCPVRGADVPVSGEDRGPLLRARWLTEAALLAVGSTPAHVRLVDLYLDALREIEDSLKPKKRANVDAQRARTAGRSPL